MPTKKRAKKSSAPRSRHTKWYLSPTFLKLCCIALVGLIGWIIYLDAQVRYRFEGKRWALPAQVYARALEIYDGRALNLNNLEQELKLLSYRKTSTPDEPGEYAIQGNKVVIYSRAHHLPEGKQSSDQFSFNIAQDVVDQLHSNNNSKQAIFSLEPYKIGGIYPHTKEERLLVSYEDIPNTLIDALIATEDRDFFGHWGVSPLGIARAMWSNMRAGKVVQGGSTLTQQLVKNFYLSRKRSISRKINEALMAGLLELHYSKTDILETYINDIFLGQSGSTAIHGFAMASEFYFGKALQNTTLAEQALLVALLKGPSYYDPRRHPERAKTRRDLVLQLMFDQHKIDKRTLAQSQAESVTTVRKNRIQTNRYPAFMTLVKSQLANEYPEDALKSEGLKIYTTLDPQLQSEVEKAVQDKIKRSQDPNLQAAAVITGVGTGEVLAVVGDSNPRYKGFNRALHAKRPIGSLIKPAVYLSALMKPEQFNLASLLNDQGFRLEFEDGQQWEPRNFDGKLHGQVPLHQALAKSYNIPTARLGLDLGIDEVRSTLNRLGIEKVSNEYPSLFLGSLSLSPFEVAKFYQTLASNGFNMPLRAIREVTTAQNEMLSRYSVDIEQVIPSEAMFLINHAMQETMRTGTGRSAYQWLPDALATAGKTGTTNDNRDSWFAGYSGDYMGVVWLGHDDNTPTRYTGSSGALNVWAKFIGRVPQYPLLSSKPEDVAFYWFDQETWKRTDDQCKNAVPLPIWGSVSHIPYQTCKIGFGSLKGWLKSWF